MSKWWASTCSPSAPIARREIVTPSCIAEMNRGGSLVIRQHGARALVPLVLELQDPRPPRRDEAVLRRDEERVQEDQAGEGQQLEGEASWMRAPRRVRTGRQIVVHANQSGRV